MADETNVPWWDAENLADERAAKEMGLPPPKPAGEVSAKDRDAEISRELDAEDATRQANLKKLGIADPEPPVQAPATAAKKGDGAELSLDEIEAELAALAALRKTDSKKYLSDPVQARERELLQAQSEAKEVEKMTGALEGLAKAATEAAPDLDASFTETFGAMSADSQHAIQIALATPTASMVTRPATDAQLSDFASISDGAAELVKSWGSRGAKELGRVHARIEQATANLSDADFERVGAWLDGLSATERVAIVRALAR
jgi:hypothetical protein